MAHILFLTQVLPYPLDAGPKVRAYYMLRHLAATHEVTLVSFVRPDDKPEYIEHLRQIAHAVHTVPMRRSFVLNLRAALKGLLSGLPIIIARDDSLEMAALLHRLTTETPFDLIHADQLSMAAWGQLAAQPSTFHHRTQGRAWVELAYDWQKVYPRVDAVVEQVLATRDSDAPSPSSLRPAHGKL